jgi:TNF receptor-associated protein 1
MLSFRFFSSLVQRGSAARVSGLSAVRATSGTWATPVRAQSSPRLALRGFATTATATEKLEFQAETRKLLDIVTHALYLEKEIFLRELISNASDAMEKRRHAIVAAGGDGAAAGDMHIALTGDFDKGTLTIQDGGVGLTRDEMVQLLGRIGKSGSQEFRQQLAEASQSGDKSSATNIIGQFGVGFYSSFMVADQVTVLSRSASDPTRAFRWTSDGTGTYEVGEAAEGEAADLACGTRITLQLKSDAKQYAQRETLERIVKKYSNFVGFEIRIGGAVVNTVKPLWLESASSVTDEQNEQFYQYVAHAFDKPRFTFRYQTDSPLHIRALFYVGGSHGEKFGMNRVEPGVSLFSRKVLIQPKAPGLLPDWLRFIKGVVDSDDVPLNIGREHLQDSALVRRLNSILTKRLLRFLADEAKRDADKYSSFFGEFGHFLKEGVCTDGTWRAEIGKLLRFNTSAADGDKLVSLDDYVARMKSAQSAIFYLVAPTRELALASPYYESFKAKNAEVLFLHTPLDEFVMNHLLDYGSKPLRSIESGEALADVEKLSADDAGADSDAAKSGDAAKDAAGTAAAAAASGTVELSEERARKLCAWMRDTFPGKLTSVKTTSRLSNTPALVVDHQSATFRRMMRAMDPNNTATLPPQQLEINPRHPIVVGLAGLSEQDAAAAKDFAEQMIDNAFVGAGLLDDARTMLPRLNRMLELALNAKK